VKRQPAGLLTTYQRKTIRRRIEIVDFVRKAGGEATAIASAAKKFAQSERNIERILARPDMKLAYMALEFGVMQQPEWSARDDIARHAAAHAAAVSKWIFVRQHLSDAERESMPFELAYELAEHRRSLKSQHTSPEK
jgi:hypothetical protein